MLRQRNSFCRSPALTATRLALCIGLALLTLPASSHEPAVNSDRLFELSLDDLLKVQVTGAAVRDLALDARAETGNPFHWQVQELPVSVEIIDHDTMQARGLNNVIEAAENLVGVLSGDSPAEPHSFSIRGFSRDSINVLHDGISLGIATLNTRPQATYTLDRLEIIKGAATLQHGQGAAGGSINLISRKPILSTETIAETIVEYGRFASSTLSAGINGPVSEQAAYRIDLNHNASDGYVDDSDSFSLTLNTGMRFRLPNQALLTFSLNYLDDELPAYWGTPLVPRAAARDPLAGIVDTADGRVLDASTRYNNYNVADHAIRSESLLSRVDFEQQASDASHWHFSFYHLTADRDWRNAESYNFDADSGLVERDRLLVSHDRTLHGLRAGYSHQHTLAGRDNRIAVNVEYSDNDFNRDIGFDADNPEPFVDTVDLFNPIAGRFGAVDICADATRTTISALVLEDAWQFSEHWRLDLALRLEQIDVDRLRWSFAGNPIARTVLDKSFSQHSYRAGLLYQLDDDLALYGHVSKQHDPFEGDLPNVFVASNFRASDVDQRELGVKALLADQQLELTLAAFQIEKQQRIQRSDSSFRDNVQQSDGVELALRATLSEDIRLGGNIAYTNSHHEQFYDAVYDLVADDSRPVNTPKRMASLWASWNRIFDLPIEVGAGLNYVSDRYADSSNTITLQSYHLLNGFIAYAEDRYRVAFNLRNGTDEVYAPWSDPTYPNQIAIGAPRSYELSLQVKF